ncbi:histidine phosphatase family protein [Bacillus fonticola]|uniref:histidine phosphatase family protein n=1 Tax=Bacillus fonticola TaxID=2728853 RepID=UPI001475C805|nr:histidine phosphatase family protein [Bacillus fonticola]
MKVSPNRITLINRKENNLPIYTKRVYFARHGHSGGAEKIISFNSHLSDLGKEQALYLKKFFLERKLDIIYTSTLERAKQTANIINTESSIPISSLEELNELHCYKYKNLEQKDILEIVNSRQFRPDDTVKNGETLRQLFYRVQCAWNIIKNSPYQDILVVSHYEVMRVFVSLLFGATANQEVNFLIAHPHCSISEIHVVDSKSDLELPDEMFVIKYLCETNHIPSELLTY